MCKPAHVRICTVSAALLCVVSLFCAINITGNVLESASSEFFVAFGGNDVDGTVPTLQLFVSSIEPDPVMFTVESLQGFTFTGVAMQNATITVTIPTTFQVLSSSERDKGIHISAGDKRLVVYGLNYGEFTSDAYVALPCNRIAIEEYEYYAVAYSDGASDRLGYILIVGCEDLTTISIGSTTITLNRMETYLWQSSNEVTGTRVTSNKPISLFSGHKCTFIPASSRACDHITEQVPPTNIWGTQFLSASYSGRRSGEIYRILASKDSTSVTVNCSTFSQPQIYQLSSAGLWQEFQTPADSFCSINSNNPLLVMEFSLGNALDGVGDPFMMMIPPTEQFGNNYVFTILPEFSTNFITVYVPTQHFQPVNIVLDDRSQDNATWTPIYCSNTTVCGYVTSASLGPGEHGLYHRDVTAHIGVATYGFNEYNSYGYPGGLELVPVQCK